MAVAEAATGAVIRLGTMPFGIGRGRNALFFCGDCVLFVEPGGWLAVPRVYVGAVMWFDGSCDGGMA